MAALKSKLAKASRTDRWVAFLIFVVVPFVGLLSATAYLAWRTR